MARKLLVVLLLVGLLGIKRPAQAQSSTTNYVLTWFYCEYVSEDCTHQYVVLTSDGWWGRYVAPPEIAQPDFAIVNLTLPNLNEVTGITFIWRAPGDTTISGMDTTFAFSGDGSEHTNSFGLSFVPSSTAITLLYKQDGTALSEIDIEQGIPTATPTNTPTSTATPTASNTPTATPDVSATPTDTPTITPTVTPSQTLIYPGPYPTNTPAPTVGFLTATAQSGYGLYNYGNFRSTPTAWPSPGALDPPAIVDSHFGMVAEVQLADNTINAYGWINSHHLADVIIEGFCLILIFVLIFRLVRRLKNNGGETAE